MSDGIKDPQQLTERLINAGEKWADLNAAAVALEESKDVVQAQILAEHFDQPEWKAKALARKDPRFQQHIQQMVEARKAANRARVRYDGGKAFVELARSAESTRRAEMNLR